jgi:hypothetical protein
MLDMTRLHPCQPHLTFLPLATKINADACFTLKKLGYALLRTPAKAKGLGNWSGCDNVIPAFLDRAVLSISQNPDFSGALDLT